MAKAAKKPAAKPAAKASASKAAPKAKPETKKAAGVKKPAAAAKAEAAPKETAKSAAKAEPIEAAPEAPPAPKLSKKEKAAKAAAEKIQSEDAKRWSDFKEKHGGQKAAAYSMSSTYEPHTPIQHKVLGWGYILSVQNDRLEVLFETGSKMLISNYKPS